jgi:enolase
MASQEVESSWGVMILHQLGETKDAYIAYLAAGVSIWAKSPAGANREEQLLDGSKSEFELS